MEQQLINKAANGNREAFITLIGQYRGLLMAVVLPILQDHHLAEDVLQESFVQIYRSLPSYRGGNFKLWLARIATNKALDWKRKEKRRCRETTMGEAEKVIGILSRGSPVENEVVKKEVHAKLMGALKELPPDYRRTISAFYIDELTYEQMAAQEGLTVKGIESRLYRARKALRAQWEED